MSERGSHGFSLLSALGLWLDFKLFGSGWGWGMPFWDGRLYWLSGRFYHWIGGLGAQIDSTEWFAPDPGTRRRLAGQEFTVFSISRSWPRVRVSWALSRLPENIDEAHREIRQLKDLLNSTLIDPRFTHQ